jgi:hypothetical protein
MLMENANLTKAQDLGADTELLSGDFFVPYGRSTSHQLWSSAMVITPTLRGLFGISVDALTKTITVNPRLPAGWDHADVRGLQIPGGAVSLTFLRNGERVEVCPYLGLGEGWHLRSTVSGATLGKLVIDHEVSKSGTVPCDGLSVPVHALEIESTAVESPVGGDRTQDVRVLSEQWGPNQVKLTIEGPANSSSLFGVHRRRAMPGLRVDSPENTDKEHLAAEISDPTVRHAPDPLKVDAKPGMVLLWLRFPPGEGWKTVTATLSW